MGAVPVVVPDLGESIHEVLILAWLKEVGDRVDADGPLIEISTDKIDAMIPAPVSGVLSVVHVAAGERVRIGAVLGAIEVA